MELHQIRYFLALADKLNFTRAAEACNVTQPALTRAIKALEAELGGDLVRRERNRTHLTDLGERMQPLFQQCYDSASLAKKLACSVTRADIAPLSLSLSNDVALDILMTSLAELFGAFPGLQLTILRGGAEEVGQQLVDGKAELAIAGPLGLNWDRLDQWTLFEDDYEIQLRDDDPLAASPTIKPADLKDHGILIQGDSDRVRAWFDGQGVSIQRGHQILNYDDMAALVRAGLGVGLVPQSDPVRDGLARRDLDGFDMSRPVSAYAVAGRPRSAAGGALLNLMRSADWAQAA